MQAKTEKPQKFEKEVSLRIQQFDNGNALQRMAMLFDVINLLTKTAEQANKKNATAVLNKDLTLALKLLSYAQTIGADEKPASGVAWADSPSLAVDDSEPNPDVHTGTHLVQLTSQAQELFKRYADDVRVDQLWAQADTALNEVMTNKLTPIQQQAIKQACKALKEQLSTPATNLSEEVSTNPFEGPDTNPFVTTSTVSPENKAAAYKVFALTCRGVLSEVDQSILQKVLKVGAAVLVTLMAASLGFAIGFLAGFAAGPVGALATGITAGAAAATTVVATDVVSYATSDMNFFKSKVRLATEAYADNVQVIDYSMSVEPSK